MGDALAVALLKKRGFKKEDFALIHPGGTIGRKLLLKVSDLMHTAGNLPVVKKNVSMKKAILEITSKKLGVTIVKDEKGRICGLITDGDLRRALEKYPDLLSREAAEIMTRSPKTVRSGSLAVEALQIMEKYSITSLVIPDEERKPIGIIHLHDILKSGIV
jgi:arabinose-5-phosphate isomerase